MIPKGIPVLLNLWTRRLDESLLVLDSISLSHSSPVQPDANISSRKGISAALVTCTSFSWGVQEDCFSLLFLMLPEDVGSPQKSYAKLLIMNLCFYF